MIYPIAAVVFGIMVGSALKRWPNVTSVLRVYQRNVDVSRKTFMTREQTFRQLTAGKPYNTDSIVTDFETQRRALPDEVGTLKLSTHPLDNSNTDYQRALGDLKNLQSVADNRAAFTGNLNGPRRVLNDIDNCGLPAPAAQDVHPAIAFYSIGCTGLWCS